MLNTIWEHSIQTEAARILQQAAQISSGFFRINGFKLVPKLYDGIKPNEAVFPDLQYNNIPRFWNRVKKVHSFLASEINADLLNDMVVLLSKTPFEEVNYQPLVQLWSSHSEKIMSVIYNLMPRYKDTLKILTINPTSYGTGGSFNLFKLEEGVINISLRKDSGLRSLVNCLLLSMTRPVFFEQYKGLWSESQLLVEWLLNETPLRDTLLKIDPNIFDSQASLLIGSIRTYSKNSKRRPDADYYQKIGLPISQKGFYKDERNVIYFDKTKLRSLSPTDYRLLSLLIDCFPRTVSTDEIADLLFNSVEEYSLYAINKAVQRLRDTLEKNGISGSYVKTVRNKGYSL